MALHLRHRTFDRPSWPLVMGILNVTPDSFSDGGAYADADAAVARACAMLAEGADIIDVGPESTRPGSAAVSAEAQIARAVPVIAALRDAEPNVVISIDTRLAPVARAALDAGADLVNDISALRDDPQLVELVAERGVPVVLMHMRGTPADMQQGGGPVYDDVVREVADFLQERAEWAIERGVVRERIIVDPGLGFGKRVGHNLQLLAGLDELVGRGYPVLVGASRKRFIGAAAGGEQPADRLAGSLTCAILAAQAGAAIVRVHDVQPTAEALRLLRAVHRDPDGWHA